MEAGAGSTSSHFRACGLSFWDFKLLERSHWCMVEGRREREGAQAVTTHRCFGWVGFGMGWLGCSFSVALFDCSFVFAVCGALYIKTDESITYKINLYYNFYALYYCMENDTMISIGLAENKTMISIGLAYWTQHVGG